MKNLLILICFSLNLNAMVQMSPSVFSSLLANSKFKADSFDPVSLAVFCARQVKYFDEFFAFDTQKPRIDKALLLALEFRKQFKQRQGDIFIPVISLKLLIEAGASLEARNYFYQTPLEVAIENLDIGAISLFLG